MEGSENSARELVAYTSGELEQREVLVKLKEGSPVMYTLTKNYDLYLGIGEHGGIQAKNCFDQRDILNNGFVRLVERGMLVEDYGRISEEVWHAIRDAVKKFIAAQAARQEDSSP